MGAKLEHLPSMAQPQDLGKETTSCSLFGRQSKIKDNGTGNSFLRGFREGTSTRGRCVSISKFGLVGADIAGCIGRNFAANSKNVYRFRFGWKS